MTKRIDWDELQESLDWTTALAELGFTVSMIKHNEHFAPCQLPTHPGRDASPSFSVNEDTLLWNCFTCDEGGRFPSLVIAMHELQDDPGARDKPPVPHADTNWQKALQWLSKYSDYSQKQDDEHLAQIQRYHQRTNKRSIERWPELPTFAPRALDQWEEADISLFTKWNIEKTSTIVDFMLRYDEDHVKIQGDNHFTGPAIIIPHFFRDKLVGYQERWPDDRPDWLPKYTNSRDFPKAESLFNWDRAVGSARGGLPIVVVESVMTVIRLHELGVPAVATFGASVRQQQLRLLGSLTSGVMLTADNDPSYINKKGKRVQGAGTKALGKVAEYLVRKIPIRIIPPAEGEKSDLADLENDDIWDLFKAAEPYTVPNREPLSSRR